MYCPNCGIKLINEEQKFCLNCGFELTGVFDTIELERETYQYREPPIKELPQTRPNYQKEVKTSGSPRSYSKKALAYSIVSIGLFIINLFLGIPILPYLFHFAPEELIPLIKTIYLIIAIMYGIGSMCGIFGTINSKKARVNEFSNGMEVVGRFFGVVGIIVNLIAFLLVSYVVPFNLYNIPPSYF